MIKMKEININIEGYNVNGICVGCLNHNRKMFYCGDVKHIFKLLGNIDVPDGLAVQVCWECLASVRSVIRFQNLILKSYDILIAYSQKHTFLNSPSDLTKHAVQRLSIHGPESIDTLEGQDSEKEAVMVEIDLPAVKTETEDLEVEFDSQEFGADDNENETKDFINAYDTKLTLDDNFVKEVSSDDDVQLSKLKKKKEKRGKKKKDREKRKSVKKEEYNIEEKPTKSRKLKNLPEHLVELVTMNEEKMWEVRQADVGSTEFNKLKYKCELCIIGFNTEKLMKDHMNGKHKPKSEDCHQCRICKAYFLTKDNLQTHKSLHLSAYKCKQCDHVTTLKRSILKHSCVNRDGAFKCNMCGEEFSTKSKQLYHRNICHQEKPQCDCCGKVFANKITLKYHLKLLLPKKTREEPKEKLYIQCKGCPKVFHSKKSYRAHVVIHDGVTYPCPTCGKMFQWKRNLARHARNHREKDAGAHHECLECGKTFASRDCYNNHMRLSKRHVHEDSYVHECSYCGKKFASKWCMVDHIDWDHLKRIKYQCNYCFKAFKTAKIMVAHIHNIHERRNKETEDQEHLCEICGKSYLTVKRLKGHMWATHKNRSTTKSFKCKLCPAMFTWQTSIYKHMKMMHDSMKRNKQSRPPAPTLPSVKKSEPYTNIEFVNRIPYFQHADGQPTNNLVPLV